MSKYWEEVIQNHFTLKITVNLKEYELCDLYLTPIKSTKDYMCKAYIGEYICNNGINPVFDVFSAFDIESAKAQAEIFVMQQINKKKDKLESEIYRYNKLLEELK